MNDKQNMNQAGSDERLAAMLNDSFPAGDPSTELEQRVGGLASRHEALSRPRSIARTSPGPTVPGFPGPSRARRESRRRQRVLEEARQE